jgi:predicted CopG family antitoxin
MSKIDKKQIQIENEIYEKLEKLKISMMSEQNNSKISFNDVVKMLIHKAEVSA